MSFRPRVKGKRPVVRERAGFHHLAAELCLRAREEKKFPGFLFLSRSSFSHSSFLLAPSLKAKLWWRERKGWGVEINRFSPGRGMLLSKLEPRHILETKILGIVRKPTEVEFSWPSDIQERLSLTAFQKPQKSKTLFTNLTSNQVYIFLFSLSKYYLCEVSFLCVL